MASNRCPAPGPSTRRSRPWLAGRATTAGIAAGSVSQRPASRRTEDPPASYGRPCEPSCGRLREPSYGRHGERDLPPSEPLSFASRPASRRPLSSASRPAPRILTQLRLPPVPNAAEKTTQLRVPSRAEIEARSGAEDPAQRADRGATSGHRGTGRKPAMPSALAGRWARIARRLKPAYPRPCSCTGWRRWVPSWRQWLGAWGLAIGLSGTFLVIAYAATDIPQNLKTTPPSRTTSTSGPTGRPWPVPDGCGGRRCPA